LSDLFPRGRDPTRLFSFHIPDQANDPKGLSPIMFHPPCEVLERGGVKFQVSQWLRQSGALADAPSLQGCGASSFPTSGGEPFPARKRCRAIKRSAQSRQSARRSHWRRTGSRLPESSTVHSVLVAAGRPWVLNCVSAFRVDHVNRLSWTQKLDLPNQLFQQPFVGGHLVIGCCQHDNPERELLEIVLKLETFVDRQEDVLTAFDSRDQNVILLARPSQVSDRIDGRSRQDRSNAWSQARIDALVD
jgi:hypothetical protein